ncbi:unnamed protein product, partial [Brassica rapa subsp. trilocularis]
MKFRPIFVVLGFDWMCEDDDNFLCGVILDFGIFSLSDLMGVEILRVVLILEDQFLGGSGQIRYYGNVSLRLEVENEDIEHRIWYVINLLMALIGEFSFTMSQSQWIVKSGGKKGEVVKSGLRVTVPRFDNSELIASFSKTLIGRCMNPQKQDMKILLFMLPRIWNVEGRVVGTDLGLGVFSSHLVWRKTLWRVLDLPLQFRAAETLQS